MRSVSWVKHPREERTYVTHMGYTADKEVRLDTY